MARSDIPISGWTCFSTVDVFDGACRFQPLCGVIGQLIQIIHPLGIGPCDTRLVFQHAIVIHAVSQTEPGIELVGSDTRVIDEREKM